MHPVQRTPVGKTGEGENNNVTPVKSDGENSDELGISGQKNRQKKEIKKKMAAEFKVLQIQLNALDRKLVRVKSVLETDTDEPNQKLDCKQFLQLQLKTVESVNADYNVYLQ